MTEIGAPKGFVDRGDPSANDFTLTDFTTDGNVHDLDLSSIVKPGAKAVLFVLGFWHTSIGNAFAFRKKENSNNNSKSVCVTWAANNWVYFDVICPIGFSRKISYYTSNTTFGAAALVVKGWWI